MVEDKKITKPKVQNLSMESRKKLSVSGVIDIGSFNDECVIMDTELGMLIVRGENLRITKLSLDNSELNLEGSICSCEYNEKNSLRSGGGFFSKMFK